MSSESGLQGGRGRPRGVSVGFEGKGLFSRGGGPLVVGLNKYSHDVSICIASRDGEFLFGGEKERLTRAKHAGGDAGELVSHALDRVGASLSDVGLVVQNNHHHRIAPFEKRLPWAVSQGLYDPTFLDPHNLLGHAPRVEVSHHLAHAWAAFAQSPFDDGLVFVSDGMGDARSAMQRAEAGEEGSFVHDLSLSPVAAGWDMTERPGRMRDPSEGWREFREAETLYVFRKEGAGRYQGKAKSLLGDAVSPLVPVFKRWTEERGPSELFNHGFEHMESLGALYSRVSSHIFGDWNVCGKVMGLAPWASQWRSELTSEERGHLESGRGGGRLFWGDLEDSQLEIDWEFLESLPFGAGWGKRGSRAFHACLAEQVQSDLENVSLAFLKRQAQTSEGKWGVPPNLCLVGGVALNSVLNGKISSEATGFKEVFVPATPGDEGIAVGCAAFGVHHFSSLVDGSGRQKESRRKEAQGMNGVASSSSSSSSRRKTNPFRWGRPLVPFGGCAYDREEIEGAVEEFRNWIEVRRVHSSEDALAEAAASRIAEGEVVAWCQGGAEMGPRALGHRSILADPRRGYLLDFINTKVKSRETFRPLAPVVLAEKAGDWFHIPPAVRRVGSPFMSLTASVREEQREKIPAVTHIDGSARLQTVLSEDEEDWEEELESKSGMGDGRKGKREKGVGAFSAYRKVLLAFERLTKVPVLLNTSLNVGGEPIVETPEDALTSFLAVEGSISALFLGPYELVRRDLKRELEDEGEKTKSKRPTRVSDEFAVQQVSRHVSRKEIRETEEVDEVILYPSGGVGDDGKRAVSGVRLSGTRALEALRAVDGRLTCKELGEKVGSDVLIELHKLRVIEI
uniref:Carbamoyltransferase n=1 Tax=Chromera velia CCMP2878 TaxID=1169474 RepID=A0A0G4FTF1_9ALVE|eukprot:Cvel_18649.t1-p1 / transcript=Cvel_18649.t1 / gene=Cvel_18649 / organism=Chromera_velia_CCMP2878 / gene_product=Nodulation protein NolNO, putative / transcript_product=Nodulation protein NolNO, putative / location=Cvel_scaffold1558:13726-20604(+) / protein_length=850 / sequence_SO=supercontig / SO=protein_coding / is_pseudo=false